MTPLNATPQHFSASDFLSWQRSGELDLRPPFQRNAIWSKTAKSFLIDSILRGYPVPLILLQFTTDPDTFKPRRLVVDGQQRLRTVLSYLDPSSLDDLTEDDDFRISRSHNKDLAGARIRDLSPEQRNQVATYMFSVVLLPPNTGNVELLDIFARINRTGTKLSEQEVRNGRWSGEFKQVCYDLAFENLDRWLNWGTFSRSDIHRMKEAELTSELVLYALSGMRSKTQASLDKEYENNEIEFPEASEVRKRVARTLDVLAELHSHEIERLYSSQSWIYVLFGLIYDLIYQNPIRQHPKVAPNPVAVSSLRKSLSNRIAQLESVSDIELLKALRGAATDKASREARYRYLVGKIR
jgi:hypothetical protein